MNPRAAGQTDAMNMPDRAVIPLFAAVAFGFIAGTITAVMQVFSPGSMAIGAAVGLIVFVTGFVSVVRSRGEERERWIVGAVRGAVAAACFGFLFAGLLRALRDGNILGLAYLLLGAFFAGLLTRFRVRDREQLREYGGRGQPSA